MIRELDTVVITGDIEEHKLRKGDVGTVVHRYSSGEAYEVEFVTAEGKTVALLTLPEDDVRERNSQEILHVRELTSA